MSALSRICYISIVKKFESSLWQMMIQAQLLVGDTVSKKAKRALKMKINLKIVSFITCPYKIKINISFFLYFTFLFLSSGRISYWDPSNIWCLCLQVCSDIWEIPEGWLFDRYLTWKRGHQEEPPWLTSLPWSWQN